MTNVDNLVNLAGKISVAGSVNIANYAKAQARVSQLQEIEIRRALTNIATQDALITEIHKNLAAHGVDIAKMKEEIEVLKAHGSGAQDPVTPPVTPPTPGTLLYRPPGLLPFTDPHNPDNYPGYTVIDGPSSNGQIGSGTTTDYFVRPFTAAWSSAGVSRTQISVNGRNVVILGSRVNFTSTNSIDDSVGLLLEGNAQGIVHIEGVRINACNCICVRTARTVQVQNFYGQARVFQDQQTGVHPDVIEVWSGNKSAGIKVHKLSGYSSFQPFSDLVDENTPYGLYTPAFWELKDVDVHAVPPWNDPNGLLVGLNNWMGSPNHAVWRGSNLWWETSFETNPVNRRDLGDVARMFGLQYTPQTATYAIYDVDNATLLYTSPANPQGGAPGEIGRVTGQYLRYVGHPGLANITWRWGLAPTNLGAVNASGNFVNPNAVGIGYVSPGYL